MTANNMSPNQKDLLLRAADYLTKDGAVEDVVALASAARLLRKIAKQGQPVLFADVEDAARYRFQREYYFNDDFRPEFVPGKARIPEELDSMIDAARRRIKGES